MSGIFNESNMLQALKKYIPNGKALLAGIHAVAKETEAVHTATRISTGSAVEWLLSMYIAKLYCLLRNEVL